MSNVKRETTILIPAGDASLTADFTQPDDPVGVVLFAHGSGSSRHSPRNRWVAAALQDAQLATVVADLLTEEEERIDLRTGHLRFDVDMLTVRLIVMIDWLRTQADTAGLGLGLFGASTGAAGAIGAAAACGDAVGAVVSRGGRPDLADRDLPLLQAPTLLIVGGLDTTVLELNRQAFGALKAPKRLEVVPDASHLFEEPGALDRVAELARDWFLRHLGPPSD